MVIYKQEKNKKKTKKKANKKKNQRFLFTWPLNRQQVASSDVGVIYSVSCQQTLRFKRNILHKFFYIVCWFLARFVQLFKIVVLYACIVRLERNSIFFVYFIWFFFFFFFLNAENIYLINKILYQKKKKKTKTT